MVEEAQQHKLIPIKAIVFKRSLVYKTFRCEVGQFLTSKFDHRFTGNLRNIALPRTGWRRQMWGSVFGEANAIKSLSAVRPDCTSLGQGRCCIDAGEPKFQ